MKVTPHMHDPLLHARVGATTQVQARAILIGSSCASRASGENVGFLAVIVDDPRSGLAKSRPETTVLGYEVISASVTWGAKILSEPQRSVLRMRVGGSDRATTGILENYLPADLLA